MPHRGAVTVTSVNAFSASSYSKEWSQATARLNCIWAWWLQETLKLTCPSFSEGSCRCWCPSCALAKWVSQIKATRRIAVNNMRFGTVLFNDSFPFGGGSFSFQGRKNNEKAVGCLYPQR